MANDQKLIHEQVPGYKAVLVREETKAKLKELREQMDLEQQDLLRERRLATAALDVVLADQALLTRVLERARQIVVIEVSSMS